MDGAIILSKDLKRINYANVLLTPDSKIKTNETGTRHKAGERTAKQTGTLVIAISERRNEITIYSGKVRYLLMETDELLRKTNESVQILEKQKSAFDEHVRKLTYLELRNQNSLNHALATIQKGILVQKINEDLKKNIIELGKEGALLKARIRELTFGVEKETDLVIKDYTKVDVKKSKVLLQVLNYEDLLLREELLRCLAYENETMTEPIKGWRILSKTSLPEADVAMLIKGAGSLGAAIHSGIMLHQEILGIEKAQQFKEEINKIKIGS
jgi:diadenylate cyclase